MYMESKAQKELQEYYNKNCPFDKKDPFNYVPLLLGMINKLDKILYNTHTCVLSRDDLIIIGFMAIQSTCQLQSVNWDHKHISSYFFQSIRDRLIIAIKTNGYVFKIPRHHNIDAINVIHRVIIRIDEQRKYDFNAHDEYDNRLIDQMSEIYDRNRESNDFEHDYEVNIEEKEKFLLDFCNYLTGRDRKIFRLRLHGFSYDEIGEKVNLSRERVRQLLNDIIEKGKKFLSLPNENVMKIIIKQGKKHVQKTV